MTSPNDGLNVYVAKQICGVLFSKLQCIAKQYTLLVDALTIRLSRDLSQEEVTPREERKRVRHTV